jgi:hypothetical protein
MLNSCNLVYDVRPPFPLFAAMGAHLPGFETTFRDAEGREVCGARRDNVVDVAFDNNDEMKQMSHNPMREILRNVYYVFSSASQSRWSWLTFNKRYRHVWMLVYDGETMFKYSPNGLNVVVETIDLSGDANVYEYLRRVRNLKTTSSIVGVTVRQDKSMVDSQPFLKLGMTCSELCRIGSGVQVGRVFTPFSLFKSLIALDNLRNFRVFLTML